ncbi:MAG: hypothetical protein BJ554DRAFT_8065, partial [Olpidium bornovanus]
MPFPGFPGSPRPFPLALRYVQTEPRRRQRQEPAGAPQRVLSGIQRFPARLTFFFSPGGTSGTGAGGVSSKEVLGLLPDGASGSSGCGSLLRGGAARNGQASSDGRRSSPSIGLGKEFTSFPAIRFPVRNRDHPVRPFRFPVHQ